MQILSLIVVTQHNVRVFPLRPDNYNWKPFQQVTHTESTYSASDTKYIIYISFKIKFIGIYFNILNTQYNKI